MLRSMRLEPHIAPLAAQLIDEALIADHWTDVIRLATSIRTGVTSASVMLERIGSFHRTGRIRDHGLQAQGHRASALNSVANAIVLWNTTYLEAAVRHLDRQSRPVPPDLLQHLSPLGWQHINLTGDYLWSGPGASDGKLRPLRQATRLSV